MSLCMIFCAWRAARASESCITLILPEAALAISPLMKSGSFLFYAKLFLLPGRLPLRITALRRGSLFDRRRLDRRWCFNVQVRPRCALHWGHSPVLCVPFYPILSFSARILCRLPISSPWRPKNKSPPRSCAKSESLTHRNAVAVFRREWVTLGFQVSLPLYSFYGKVKSINFNFGKSEAILPQK